MKTFQENHIEVKKTARYYTIGEVGEHVQTLWFMFHGYGQLGQFFIRHFELLDDGKCLIVAPEGLSKFYLREFDGRIGASWMTKEDRLAEISDYLTYLDTLFNHITANLDMSKVQFNLLGFSQGTATLCRWVNHRRMPVKNIVMWAGSFPKDLTLENNDAFSNVKFHFVHGHEDKYLQFIRLDEHIEMFRKNQVTFNLTMFEGKHEMKPALLAELVSKFDYRREG